MVHYPGSIFRIVLAEELDKSIALVGLRDTILGQMDIDYSTCLEHQFPYQAIRDTLVQVADVDCGLLVLLPEMLLVHGDIGKSDTPYQCRAPDILFTERIYAIDLDRKLQTNNKELYDACLCKCDFMYEQTSAKRAKSLALQLDENRHSAL